MEEQVIDDDSKKSEVDNNVTTNETTSDKVDYKTYSRVLDKLKKLERQHEEVSAKANKADILEEEKHKQEGNWKAILESRENQLKEISSEIEELRSFRSQVESEKQRQQVLNALEKEMGAKIADPDYYDLVKIDKIGRKEDGELDLVSLKEYAKEFANKHSRILETSKPKVESRAANFTTTKKDDISKDDIIKQLKSL